MRAAAAAMAAAPAAAVAAPQITKSQDILRSQEASFLY